MDINEIKKNLYTQYMQVAYNLVRTNEYKKYRIKHLFIFFSFILVFIIISLWLITRILVSGNFEITEILFGDTSLWWLCAALIISIVFTLYNKYYATNIKSWCIKNIMKDLSDIRYYSNIPKDESCIIKNSDIDDFNLTEYYDRIETDDIFVGNYNGIEYNILENKLWRGYGKHSKIHYEGIILKTNVNIGINGWIEFSTNEMADKEVCSFAFCFINCFLILTGISIILSPFFQDKLFPGITQSIPFLTDNPDLLFILVFVIDLILAYVIIKSLYKFGDKESNPKQQEYSENFINEIDEQFEIKTSGNIYNLNETFIKELAEIINKLKILFNTKLIKCKFYDNKVMLAVKSKENMFEMGGLFVPPTNPKVADRFVSQMSGIILFLDYISNIKQD